VKAILIISLNNSCYVDNFWFQCHETRSQFVNRQKARERLAYKLDILYNGENSFDAISKREKAESIKKADSKAQKRRQMKQAFKEENQSLKD